MSRGATGRPFYGSFAWAFDLLVERPVTVECAHIAAVLSARAVPRDGRLLDAGCGTGRYALTLAGLGYRVTGLDLSPELIAVARQRPGAAAVGFEVGDLTRPAVGSRTVETPRGRLVYRDEVRLDHARRRMLVAERHTLTTDGGTTSADYDFVMRCWTQSELDERLAGAGFGAVEYSGAYDPTVPLGSTDRIVAVASRS